MPALIANRITIEYDTFGSQANAPLLLVMGLGAQMIAWDEAFCQQIADRGFFVIRHDNRDCGLSSKIEDGPEPNMMAALSGDTSSASYALADMASDSAALLEALGFASAHIVGASMGGMIVQQMAIDHPARVRSMTSIMSTTGDRAVGQSKPEAIAALMAPPPTTRAEAIDRGVAASKIIGSTGFPFDEEHRRRMVARSYDRAFYPIGTARQMLAVVAGGDRTEGLKSLAIPVAVIHGEVDPLVTISGGEATAAAIACATFVPVPGMGHDLPIGAWPVIIGSIAENAARAAAAAK